MTRAMSADIRARLQTGRGVRTLAALVGVAVITVAIPGVGAAPAPGEAPREPTSSSPSTTATASPTTSIAAREAEDGHPHHGDDIDPPTEAEKAAVHARAAAYDDLVRRQRGAEAASPEATPVPPDWMPWVGAPRAWCTYSNPGSPGDYCRGYHPYPALDIEMPVGVEITAAGAGVVVVAFTGCGTDNSSCGGGAGNHIGISHGNSRYTRYLHLSAVDVSVGDIVDTGDRIGLSGWSGRVSPHNESAAHLHFEENFPEYGKTVDPGEMRRCVNGQLLQTLAPNGWKTWNQVPWGTLLRNDGTACLGSQPTAPPWTGAIPFGGAAPGRVASGTNRDGRQELFVVGAYGLLWHSFQTAPNGLWSNWAPYPGVSFPATATPSVVANSDGRLEVFIVRGGALWHTYQLVPNGSWSSLSSLGGSLSDDPTVGRNADGHLEVFARHTDGTAWHIFQQAANTGWLDWYRLGGAWPAGTTFGVASNHDGRLEVFGTGHDNQVWHSWQGSPNGMFSGFSPLGGAWPKGRPLAVTRSGSGRLSVFGTTGAGLLERFTQTVPNGSWGAVTAVSAGWSTAPAAVTDRTGRINLAAMTPSNGIAVQSQTGVDANWFPVTNIGGSGAYTPALGLNADGRVEAFFTGANSAIYHAWQQRPP